MSRHRPQPKIVQHDGIRIPRLKRGWHSERVDLPNDTYEFFHVRNGYRVVRCTGDAHSNAYIDHCMTCLGHAWGWIAVKDE
jgi:hypothetical protein